MGVKLSGSVEETIVLHIHKEGKVTRKSAPKMGFWMSAMTKIYLKVLRSPMFRVSDRVP